MCVHFHGCSEAKAAHGGNACVYFRRYKVFEFGGKSPDKAKQSQLMSSHVLVPWLEGRCEKLVNSYSTNLAIKVLMKTFVKQPG